MARSQPSSTGGLREDTVDPKLIAQFSLEGRRAVIVGAASGIGRQTAVTFAQAGARLVLADLDEGGLAETRRLVGDAAATTVVVDVRDRASVQALAEQARAQGPVDVWANVAGVLAAFDVVDAEEPDVDRILSVNLKGVYWGCAEAARIMTSQRRGSIINISSAGADAPSRGLSVYVMTKAAVNALTRTLAIEVGPSGVRVNAVAPGYIDTPMVAHRFRAPDGGVDPERREKVFANAASRTVLGRIGAPSDVAMAMLYLASDASGWVTGQVMRPNGGMAMP
jgi:3-oxoacyl-[acyl-carrier protein] reductase